MAEATQRCVRCGNDNRADSFACSFCGKRLRIERIENITFFRRYEAEEWIKPDPWYIKIAYLYVRPNRAFWDINHKRDKAPGFKILLFSSLLYGLMGLAFFSHFQIVSYNGVPLNENISSWMFFYGLSFFVLFFLFGYIFQFLYFIILIWLFTKGANYAVGFSERMEARFGEGKDEQEKFKEEEMSPFSIYKGGILLQKQESHKKKMLLCAFAPYILINGIKALIILVAFPTVQIDIASFDPKLLEPLFRSPAWIILDILDIITLAVWVPILITIGIRELSNSSTFRVLISSLIIGVIVALFFYIMRPTIVA